MKMIKTALTITILLALAGCTSSTSVIAESKDKTTGKNIESLDFKVSDKDKSAFEHSLVGKFEVMKAALLIEEHCQSLSFEHAQTFAHHVASFERYLTEKEVVAKPVFSTMKQNAKFNSALPKYSQCDQVTKDIIQASYEDAKSLYNVKSAGSSVW